MTQKSNERHLLIIGNLNIIFTFEFLSEVLSLVPDTKLSVFNLSSQEKTRADAREYCEMCEIPVSYAPINDGRKKRRLPYFDILWRNFMRFRRCRQQDIILVHLVPSYAAAIAMLAPRRARVVVSYYGSDLLRADSMKLLSQRLLLRRADQITVATDYMKSMVSQYFRGRFDHKVVKVPYGAKVIDSLSALKQQGLPRSEHKRFFGFPEDKIVVHIGYNGSRAQQHIPITQQLATLPEAFKQRLYLVYFCSYGLNSQTYLAEIQAALAVSGIAGQVYLDYLKGENMARFRLAADLMLNLQLSDAFSASMLEHLEAGTLVIKGDWLVYPELDRLGAKVISLQHLDALPGQMIEILGNMSRFEELTQQNEGLIYRFLSWETNQESWLRIITGDPEST